MDHTQVQTSNQPSESQIPYWLVNVPETEWPKECPDFLKNITPKDRAQLGTPDERFRKMSWAIVKTIVETNRLGDLRRVPSSLRRYREFQADIKLAYGSILNFVQSKRLKWLSLEPASTTPFECSDDLKILCNDWPYGVDEKIVHLVVWTKFVFDEDPETGDLTKEARKAIAIWVRSVFVEQGGIAPERVIWFKNWASIKSVHAIEHFHVMLMDPNPAFVKDITHEDISLEKIMTETRERTRERDELMNQDV